MLSVSLDCFCFVFLRLVYPMLSVSLDCFCFVCLTRRRKTKQKQSRETDNIGYTRRRKTKQKQSRETDNIGSGLFLFCLSCVLCTLCCQFLWIVFVLFVLCLVYPMLLVSLDCLYLFVFVLCKTQRN
jgi:hypothetical protein